MKKRFTDADIWFKKWYRKLKPEHKLFWNYLKDRCDHAGIWEVDFENASHFIGAVINEEEMINLFAKKIAVLDDGEKWFIIKFIEFQYGKKLKPNVNAHKSVIDILSKYGLINDDYTLNIEDLSSDEEELSNPSPPLRQGGKTKIKTGIKIKTNIKTEETNDYYWGIFNQKLSPDLMDAWREWLEYCYSTDIKVNRISIVEQLNFLREQDKPADVIKQSIKNNWKGLFPIKENNGTFKQQPAKGSIDFDKYKRLAENEPKFD